MSPRTVAVATVLGLVFAHSAVAQRSCVKDQACVYTQDGRDEVTFWVEVMHTEPVRILLVVDLLNMVADRELPHSALYQPGTTTKILTATRFRQNQAVSYKWRFYTQPGYEPEMSCSAETVCVLPEYDDGKVLFWGINLTDRFVSVEFRPRTFDNLASREGLPVVRTVPPADSVLLVETYVVDPSRQHRYSYSFPWRFGDAGRRHSLDAAYLVPHTVPDRPVRKGAADRPDERNGVYWYMPEGAQVRVARAGTVFRINEFDRDSTTVSEIGIQHDDGSQGIYRYLDRVDVAVDSLVTPGIILGRAPEFVMLTVQILRPDFSYVSVPIRFYRADGSIRALRTGETN